METTVKVNGKEVKLETPDNPTEKLLNEVKVKQAIEIKEKKKGGVTAKTLGAFAEQMRRVEEDKLLDDDDMVTMKILMGYIRENWIKKNL